MHMSMCSICTSKFSKTILVIILMVLRIDKENRAMEVLCWIKSRISFHVTSVYLEVSAMLHSRRIGRTVIAVTL
jgi:hypothetical protein